ncbi:MAG TPA: BTAD domain-containing putative transcriptional regulator [Gemmatimonadaceae bacterium]|nr:BTAD domain-containing putative transcriptional regulator [Gemmatimonadaceae bacterium]
MHVIWLQVLGGASLQRGDVTVRGKAAQRRRLALLTILAVARDRMVGRERVLALLWPEQSAEGGRRLLSEALYVLRKEFGEEIFRSQGDEIGLEPSALGCDVWAFEDAIQAGRLDDAVARYHGPLLDGFFVSEAEGFEKWVDGERARLARTFAQTLEQLAERCEADGQPARAVGWWSRLLDTDPSSSRVAARLMLLLERHGDFGEAIRVGERHVAWLRDEIGADPPGDFARELERVRRAPSASLRLVPAPSSEGEASRGAASSIEGMRVDGWGVAGAAPTPGTASDPGRRAAALPARAAPAHRRILGRRARAVLGAVLALGLSISVVAYAIISPHSAVRYDPRHVAVLYFDDLSADRSLAHVANGLTETLIHELGRIRSLRVVPRNGVRQYRDSIHSLESVVAGLRVGTVVEASLQRSHDRLRVTVGLIDGATLRQLESTKLERPLGELFALEDDIATEVAGFLRRRLGEEIRLHDNIAGTRSSAARVAYLHGEEARETVAARLAVSHAVHGGNAATPLATADSLFLLAARHDPRWLRPWLGRGWVAILRASLGPIEDATQHLRAAERFADSALARSPNDAEALELRGTARWRVVHLGRIDDRAVSESLLASARQDLEEAVSAAPSLARAWSTLSQLLRLQGDLAAADAAAERALVEDEFIDEAPLIVERLYRSSFALGRYDRAQSWCLRGRSGYPNDWRFLDCALTLMGYESGASPDPATAWTLYDELYQLDPPHAARHAARPYQPIYRLMAVSRVLARAGLRDSSRALIAAARSAVGEDADLEASLMYDEAYVRLLLGELDAAAELLERYVQARPQHGEYVARDVQFRRLRGHPRYDAIASRP